MEYTYYTSGVCSRKITILMEDGKLENVSFESGCQGNLRGISQLVKGLSPGEVIARLEGIDCNYKGTSCPDQLARALRQIEAETQPAE